MTVVEVFVPGIPVPQGSLRAFVRGGHAAVTSDNAGLRSWRHDVAAALSEARDGTFDGPVVLRCEFRLPRPLGHYGRHGVLPSAPVAPARKPDLDKLVRAIGDAATAAGVWRDDAQVVKFSAAKRWVEDGGTPGVEIRIYPWGVLP